jgi:hypothetical protein
MWVAYDARYDAPDRRPWWWAGGPGRWVRVRRVAYQPTATTSHCGLPWEMKEDWPA